MLGREPVVDSSGNHNTAAPAAGWVKRVYLASYEEGGVTGLALWADVKWTSLGAKLLTDDQYKYGSVEIGSVTVNATGDEVPNVMRSLTLCNTPVLSIMPGVKDAAAKQLVLSRSRSLNLCSAAAPPKILHLITARRPTPRTTPSRACWPTFPTGTASSRAP